MVKAIIFDWDGTLVNNVEEWFNSFNHVLEEFDSESTFIENFREPMGGLTDSFQKFGILEDSQMDFIANWVSNYDKFSKFIKMHTDVKELLIKLKLEGYKLGIVTNGNRERVRRELKFLGLEDFFDVVVTKEEGKEKPIPEKLKKVAEKIGLKEDDCVYIGDMDIDSTDSNNTRMKSISVLWGLHGPNIFKKLGTEVVEDINSLYLKIKNI